MHGIYIGITMGLGIGMELRLDMGARHWTELGRNGDGVRVCDYDSNIHYSEIEETELKEYNGRGLGITMGLRMDMKLGIGMGLRLGMRAVCDNEIFIHYSEIAENYKEYWLRLGMMLGFW